ncbi:MAG: hypothetical protein ACFE0P_15265 [Oceanicaulis sp.]
MSDAMRRLIACLALMVAVFAAPAFAEPSVREAYEAGDWAYAQTLAASASDAGSKTIAAEAALAPLMLGAMTEADRYDKRMQARAAVALAEAALDLDQDHARAHIVLAVALGYEGRYSNPLAAALARLPQRARRHAERALEIEPGNAWALAMLGAWHMEIVRRAGERTFGADLGAGLQHYRAAAKIAQTPDIPYHFALALLAEDAETHGEEALQALRAADAMGADTALETGMRERARDLLRIAETFRAAAADEAVRRLEE